MFVIGTAGHVDHGKSTLVKALTGIDPDRLREEKERGLTIDIGFAWLALPSGRDVSIVDVPGHERFIKNMLAGAGGVDLALLIVAADEGPMPQTHEHLAILDLLDVPAGLVVITKTDLVESEYIDLVEAELEDVLKGSRLEGAPIARVSASTGDGIPALLTAIDAALDTTPPKRDLGRPRMPIDRAFTIQGFGTVVTGTLVDGALEVGQDVELQPGRLRARIRGLQRHKEKVQRLEPGTRAAVNLSGVHADDIERGMVLARPGAIKPVRAMDVRLRATKLLPHAVSDNAGITFLSATAEAQGTLRLLDRAELLPGDVAWAQVVLETPVAVLARDHYVIRTTNDTVGGGPIVALSPPRHRRNHVPTLEALALRLEGSPAERMLDELAVGPTTLARLSERLGVETRELQSLANELVESDRAAWLTETMLSSKEWLENQARRILTAISLYLEQNSLRELAPREHVRSSVGLETAVFEMVVQHAVASRSLVNAGAGLGVAGYTVVLSPAQQREADAFLAAIRAGGTSPPAELSPEPALVALLAHRGLVVDVGGGVVFDADVYAGMTAKVRAHIEEHGSISLAETRDLLGSSRKYVQAFLEHLDAQRVTRRVGDARVLRAER